MQKMPAPVHFIPSVECVEVNQVPEGKLWQYELKPDGYHPIAIKQDGGVDLFSRNRRVKEEFPYSEPRA